jgi:hypothetical protein
MKTREQLGRAGSIEKSAKYLQKNDFDTNDANLSLAVIPAVIASGIALIPSLTIIPYALKYIESIYPEILAPEIMIPLIFAEIAAVALTGFVAYNVLEKKVTTAFENIKAKDELVKSPEERSYTHGATAIALQSGEPTLPPEMGFFVSKYLDRTDGANIACTCMAASFAAEIERQNQIDKSQNQKSITK